MSIVSTQGRSLPIRALDADGGSIARTADELVLLQKKKGSETTLRVSTSGNRTSSSIEGPSWDPLEKSE